MTIKLTKVTDLEKSMDKIFGYRMWSLYPLTDLLNIEDYLRKRSQIYQRRVRLIGDKYEARKQI
jgi:hypothetical protein